MRLFIASLLLTACATPPPQPEVTPAVNCYPEVAGSETPGVVMPIVVHKEPPKTPYVDGNAHPVEMDAIVDEAGKVVDICPVRGERAFFDAAEKALRQWRFKPATLDGKPVPFRFHFTTRFSSS
jgi:hypothetical protein